MTATNFPLAYAYTLGEEGSWSNDPRDAGGATMDGITLASYRIFEGNPQATAAELHAIGAVQREAFYGREWNAVMADALPSGVDLSVFDAHVNTGSNAAKQLQRVVGLVGSACDGWIGAQTVAAVGNASAASLALRLKPGIAWGVGVLQAGLGLRMDGQMGPATLAAAKAHRDAVLVAALYDQQAGFYLTCSGFAVFGAGWLSRAKRRAAAGMRLAVPAGVLRAPIS